MPFIVEGLHAAATSGVTRRAIQAKLCPLRSRRVGNLLSPWCQCIVRIGVHERGERVRGGLLVGDLVGSA
jgi:hypothetical protein